MSSRRWNDRFFATTRGQVVALLRRASHTVNELAAALGLTDNAVRAHLTTLERDGLVRQEGVRRGAGKPSYAYALTPEAELLFPKAYGPVLHEVLDVLSERLRPDDLESALREAGRRLAAGRDASGDLRQRVDAAVGMIEQLGGLAEVEEGEKTLIIQGYSCPLVEAVPGHPEVCRLLETLLSEVVRAEVRECCERDGVARCRFDVDAASPNVDVAG